MELLAAFLDAPGQADFARRPKLKPRSARRTPARPQVHTKNGHAVHSRADNRAARRANSTHQRAPQSLARSPRNPTHLCQKAHGLQLTCPLPTPRSQGVKPRNCQAGVSRKQRAVVHAPGKWHMPPQFDEGSQALWPVSVAAAGRDPCNGGAHSGALVMTRSTMLATYSAPRSPG